MKQFLTLEGNYAGKQVRRLKKFGRVELLRVFHDPEEIIQEPYQDRAAQCSGGATHGNGYWRYCHLELAQAKFDELAAQPESVAEEGHGQAIRAKARERAMKHDMAAVRLARNRPPAIEGPENP